VALGVTAIAAAGGATVPAAATTQFAVDHFWVCMDGASGDCAVSVQGAIVWGQRTATISGNVYNGRGGMNATAFFDAYARTTHVDATTRTAGGVSTTPFSFVIGDTNRPGGINKIVIFIEQYNRTFHIPGDTDVQIRD
jgi:hypothetical protein